MGNLDKTKRSINLRYVFTAWILSEVDTIGIVFIVLKTLGIISWGWIIVFSPIIITLLGYIILLLTTNRRLYKSGEEDR